MVADANGCDAVFVDANPFMGGGELTIVWNSAHVVFLACRPLGQCQLGLFCIIESVKSARILTDNPAAGRVKSVR
jgi:hypothetical protein